MEKKLVILGGCPRSGTTALTRLLHGHPDFAIGMEQFNRGWGEKRVTRAAFSEEGLTRFNPELSMPGSKDRIANRMTVEKYRAAKWVGDKLPLLHTVYENVDAEMPEAEILFIVRNPLSVMESYHRRHIDPNDKTWRGTPLDAIKDWNLGVREALERIKAGKPLRVVSFEKAFASREAISRVYAVFGASISDVNERLVADTIDRFWELQGKDSPRNETFRRLVSEKCAFRIYRTLVREHCILADLSLLEADLDGFLPAAETRTNAATGLAKRIGRKARRWTRSWGSGNRTVSMEKKLVILGGCPRSGTTALTRLLHGHPDFAIGWEQFHRGWVQNRITRAAFSEEGLTRFNPTLSTPESKDRIANWMTVEKYRAAKWVGDKLPLLHRVYENIDAEMPEAEILFIVRNPLSVMESYHRRHIDPNDKTWRGTPLDAIKDWNLSVSKALERIDAGKPLRVLSYEKAFASREAISRVYATFGASISDADERLVAAMIDRFWELQVKDSPRNEAFRRLVSEKCAFGIYRTLLREHCILADLPLLEADAAKQHS